MKKEKKNIFDTDIEMIDLDSVGDLEFRYEELGAPNPELGDDLKMVMKETQVFSSDEIEKALEKNAVEEMGLDMGQTRVIDSVEEVEGFLSDEEVAETVNEEVYEAPDETSYDETVKETAEAEYSEDANYDSEAYSDEAEYEEAKAYSDEPAYNESVEYSEKSEYEEYDESVEEGEYAEDSEEPEYEESSEEYEET